MELTNETVDFISMIEGRVADYALDGCYDELLDADGRPRPHAASFFNLMNAMTCSEMQLRQRAVDAVLMNLGITFTVYGDDSGTEKIFPFDIVPRILPKQEWQRIERGLQQRITALNLFLGDVYGDQKILKDKIIPEELVLGCGSYRAVCHGLKPPLGVWCHITGTDLVRDDAGTFYVLEDNLRCPSGVSYVLQNRKVLKRIFPEMFAQTAVRPVDDYPGQLLETLSDLKPGHPTPSIAVLTPGIYNSAYFEHAYLAQQLGAHLVAGNDLIATDTGIMMRTTGGLERVDVIYRRIDDDFLDPRTFREDSMLGVPGLMEAYRKGQVALANAPGTGIADDKAVYAYVPKMIKYYLNEEPIIANVPTHICREASTCAHVLDNLDTLVVKAVNQSGGYGMLIGPHASRQEREAFAAQIKANPNLYIAQPTLNLSRSPTMVNDHLEGRHVDLRPYILHRGDHVEVMPGGLTRVALRKGSLVVNSSQGGGSKDTWVLA